MSVRVGDGDIADVTTGEVVRPLPILLAPILLQDRCLVRNVDRARRGKGRYWQIPEGDVTALEEGLP